jgi:hypothetical protein
LICRTEYNHGYLKQNGQKIKCCAAPEAGTSTEWLSVVVVHQDIKELFQVILVHGVLHKSQAILCLLFTVVNLRKQVKEISFKNGIELAGLSVKCMTE